MAKKKKKPDLYQRPDGLYEKGVTINGKRVRFRGHSEKEILQKIAAYKEKEETGKTFKEVADAWYLHKASEIQPTTLKRSYKPLFDRIVLHFGTQYINQIKPKDVQQFVSTILTYSQKSVNNHLSIVKQIFDFAVVTGELEHNPAASVKIPKGLKKNKRDMITDRQKKIIEANTDYPVFGLFAYFLLYTGCRRGEALALKWSDIDFSKKLIYITKSAYYNSNKPEFKTPKTDAGEREIILMDKLATQLQKCTNQNGYIFSVTDGKEALKESQATKGWDRYVKATGLKGVTPHMLRHTYASLLYEAGIDVKSAQDLLGHADISTTQNIYTHITKTKKEQTADKLNDYFK